MPITKLLSIVALMLNCSVLLLSQGLTRDIIKYNFASASFDTVAGVEYDLDITSASSQLNFGEMYPMEVPLDRPVINLTEGTNFTEPLVAKENYSMETYPVSTTIKIFKLTGDQMRDQCTGTMVGPRHILTSAHCFLKPYTVDVVVQDLVAVVGYDVSMDSTKHRSAKVTDAYFLDEWNIGYGDDQAILEIEEPLGFYTGWASIGFNDDDEFFRANNFHKFSYPTYNTPYNERPFNGDTLYYSYGVIDHVVDDFLGVVNHLKGAGGESGSSLLYTNNDDIYVSYGVLTWVGFYNHSRFNSERYHAFSEIMAQIVKTSTVQLADESEVLLYPSPSSNWINIKSNAAYELKRISLHDSNGRLIRSFAGAHKAEHRIDISNLKGGLYYIQLVADEGLITTKRFIKH